MQTIKLTGHLTLEEKETLLSYDSVDKKWTMDTTVMKYYNKAKKQGWVQLKEYVYEDGAVCGGVFEAPSYAITIRSTSQKKMSEKQMGNLFVDEDEDENC